MPDPLHRVSVRTKLALLFVGLGLIAYGLGGFLVSRGAEAALEQEILARLDHQCRAHAAALDGSLRLLERRLEDFASDGYIRDHAARLQQVGGDPDVAGRLRDELERHLTRNKLPLVAAYRNLAVLDAGGGLLAAVHDEAALEEAARAVDLASATTASGLVERGAGADPGLVLSTPLRALDGSRLVGRLAVLVAAEDWLTESLEPVDGALSPGDVSVQLALRDRAGRRLVADLGPTGLGPVRLSGDGPGAPRDGLRYAPVRGTYARAFPVAASGWTTEVSLGIDEALQPVSGLRSRLLGVGIVLALISVLLLWFPMRFVVRPLVLLTRAAERLREGRLETRVEVASEDEIGELGEAFNSMARAIQERTARLEATATDLRARQAELRAERDRLDAVIDSMVDGLLVLDAGGRVVLANAAAQPLLDLVHGGRVAHSHQVCRDETALGDGHHAVGPGEAAGREAGARDCFACLLDPSGPSRSCAVDVDGRTFEVHTTLLPPDAGGGRGRVLVSRDVTENLAQDERQIHNERLAVLGEVAAVVAHELNNPLASISMFNQMLASELPADSPLRENVDVIGRNTESAKRTIRELLDYATGATPEIGPLDVHDTLEDVVRFLAPLSERAGVDVRLEASAGRSEVTGDEIQLRQVFINLALNGIQAVAGRSLAPGTGGARAEEPAGRPREVVLATRNEGDRLLVDVHDTGPGIAPEDRERIFRPFYTTKSRGEGTGLGLSTARRIAEMQGGSLTLVESSPAGSVFRVRLRSRQPVEAAT